MGEYAEMMLDGTCCEGCGEFIGEATGFPGYCSKQCAGDRGVEIHPRRKLNRHEQGMQRHAAKHFACDCGKRFRYSTALEQHKVAKHGTSLPSQRCAPESDAQSLEAREVRS